MRRNIAIYYPSLEQVAGIEKVIERQCRILGASHTVILVTEYPVVKLYDHISPYCTIELISHGDDRQHRWKQLCEQYAIDYIIIHGAYYAEIRPTIEALSHVAARTILNVHYSFPSPLYLPGDELLHSRHLEVARHCDAIVTVSEADSVFWKALGISSIHVQNPVECEEDNQLPCSTRRFTIIWIGRISPQKQPEEALYVLAELRKLCPRARMIVLGAGNPRTIANLRHLAKSLHVEKAVSFEGHQVDVAPYWEQAGIHLLTSITESFCLVLAEAKMRALPSVMYSIPYLDLTKDKRGLFEAEQGDRVTMAKHLASLMNSPEAYQKACTQARESLQAFNDDSVRESWQRVFDSLEHPAATPRTTCSPFMHEMIIRELNAAWNFRMKNDLWKIRLCDDAYKFKYTRFLICLLRFVIGLSRKIKKKINKQIP